MKTIIAILISTLILITATFIYFNSRDYVRGLYGGTCYAAEKYHGNIKNIVYYKSYDACVQSIFNKPL